MVKRLAYSTTVLQANTFGNYIYRTNLVIEYSTRKRNYESVS